MRTLQRYARREGPAGIRNHVAVMPSVACAIARIVPEVVPLYHGHGCGRNGED
ncbi:MAG: hypothetical protein SWK76_01150 [Actinomycetota bacterium]|nr:hypothetical protein [Actinomycetota bacterium]